MPQQATSTLAKLMAFAEQDNLCGELDEDKLRKIGRDVVRLAKSDDQSRGDWVKKSEKGMDLALQVVETKTTPWPGASNVKYPLITVAALQFHARCYPAVVSGNNVVKGKITGMDEDGMKALKSRLVASHMNWQLLEENEDWEEDVDKMLLALPIEGCEFKKSYFSKERGYNVSEWVRPLDFIVPDKTKSLESCPRMTHRIWYYPHEIDERWRNGLWREENLQISETDIEEEVSQEFYEQHTFLDLDGDGYKEPYIVTVHVKSEQVVRIVAGFFAGDIVIRSGRMTATVKDALNQALAAGAGAETQEEAAAIAQLASAEIISSAEIVKVPRNSLFTKYGFIPSPDGSFYDIGFGKLIGPLSDSIDTNINQLLDAGTLANMQAGFIQDGVSIDGRRGALKFDRGEFKRVKLPAGVTMNNAIFQIKFPEPSPVLFQLLGMLVQSAKDITSIQDIMTGANQQVGQAATTSMIQVEQGLKVFSSIYKRIYRSLKHEFKKLYRLNSRYLLPQQVFRVLDTDQAATITIQAYQGDGTDVQPVADPQLATNTMALAKTQAMLGVMNHPLVADEQVLRDYFAALDVPMPDKYLVPPEQRQQPPDPELVLKAQIAASEHSKRIAEIAKLYAEALDKVASAEEREIGTQMHGYIESLKLAMQGMSNGANQGSPLSMAAPSGNAGGFQAPLPLPGGGGNGFARPGEPFGAENGGNGGVLPGGA